MVLVTSAFSVLWDFSGELITCRMHDKDVLAAFFT
ncbi:hypothetical protein SLEP1_g12604 [Rubroshorea leprosula]|uniref:Uncharacterized protein n=1 Tax=Rubroshorea leprosula TaxID=152421 RepID=A0AAV5IJ35_9ROSI|nr:hypothetical protein SLEP1_g12604 [Rubroshorea leprosula]